MTAAELSIIIRDELFRQGMTERSASVYGDDDPRMYGLDGQFNLVDVAAVVLEALNIIFEEATGKALVMGTLRHGKGCFQLSEDGGGEESEPLGTTCKICGNESRLYD